MRGGDFADQLARQVREQGAQLRMEGVSAMRTRGEVIELTTDGGTEECLALVLATGVSHRKLGLAGEADLVGAGLSYCAVCDGAFYQGRPVAVVGGGDAALQEALFLSQPVSYTHLWRPGWSTVSRSAKDWRKYLLAPDSQGAVDYEFRTTVVREFHNRDSFRAIGPWLSGARRYFLQSLSLIHI